LGNVFDVLEIVLLLCAGLLLFPSAFLFLECLAAPYPAHHVPPQSDLEPRTTLLIPARDEAIGIARTITSARAAGFPRMDILVVADNCNDATAEIARAEGVRVIDRRDTERIGKGYALAFGIDALKMDPPEVVIVLDADCVVARTALQHLAGRAFAEQRPLQAAYTLRDGFDVSPKTALSNFAFLVKNVARPAGLKRLNAPCLLTGSGMAFPWSALECVLLDSGHLSEDMWLSVELACAGYAPRFCEDAAVFGEPPRRERMIKMQRARWERGHLDTMVRGIPKLVWAAWTQCRVEALWLALELSVPPLALLLLLISGVMGISFAGILFGLAATPFGLVLLDFVLVSAAVLVAWWKFGRAYISAKRLFAAPLYVIWKIPLYADALRRRRIPWTRTERDISEGRGE
jgi:cellulose synthase/poly-beta-1,6-N-acetylglucosamine synthase-like glycosyltransferase